MNQMEMAMDYVRAMENNVSPDSVGKKSLTFIMDALKEKQKRDEESCKGEEQIYQYQNDWDECEWEGLGIEDDLISRRAMYIALNDLGGCDATEDYYKGYDSGIDAAISALQCAPTMGEEQVRHGKWIKIFMKSYEDVRTGDMKRHYLYECPICGYHTGNQGGEFNYCPHCGAKMDLEESE